MYVNIHLQLYTRFFQSHCMICEYICWVLLHTCKCIYIIFPLQQFTIYTVHGLQALARSILQYALLKVATWYPDQFGTEKLYLHEDLLQTLLPATPVFHKAFTERYASKMQVDICVRVHTCVFLFVPANCVCVCTCTQEV